jgi:hypothetical protein
LFARTRPMFGTKQTTVEFVADHWTDAIGGALGALAVMSVTIADAMYGCCSKRQ